MDDYIDVKINVFEHTGQRARVRRSITVKTLIDEILKMAAVFAEVGGDAVGAGGLAGGTVAIRGRLEIGGRAGGGGKGDDGGDAGEAALLGEGREDEVGVPDGEEAEPALGPLLPALADDAAGADGDPRLADLVAGAAGREVGVEEGADAVLLVVLQDEPRGARGEDAREEERRPEPARKAAQEEGPEEEGGVGESHAEVGLEEDEAHREGDDADERADRLRGEQGAVVVLEDPGEEEDGRDPRELRRLELEAAEEADPRLRPRDRRSEDRQPDERQERDEELPEDAALRVPRDAAQGAGKPGEGVPAALGELPGKRRQRDHPLCRRKRRHEVRDACRRVRCLRIIAGKGHRRSRTRHEELPAGKATAA